MRASFYTFVVCALNIYGRECKSEYDNSGWRPLSKTEVYNRFQINIHKRHDLPKINDWKNTIQFNTENNIHKLRNDAMKLVNLQPLFTKFNTGYEEDHVEKKIEVTSTERGTDADTVPLNYQQSDDLVDHKRAHTRIAKKISDNRSMEKVEHKVNFDQKKGNLINKDLTSKEELSTGSDNSRNYQVTENIDDLKSTIKKHGDGYKYNPPATLFHAPGDSNITKEFLNILSRYNIDDKITLRNYELSRGIENRNYVMPEVIYLPVPLRPFQYNSNSQNHIPVNPILAVFLSNYGYYLPGSYGIQNKYKNLYGYLASNNIHNNKPFGMYKMFSDNDSSY